MKFAVVNDYLVTASDDGSIPLNSRVVATVEPHGVRDDQAALLLQANTQPDLQIACNDLLNAIEAHGPRAELVKLLDAAKRRAHAALAAPASRRPAQR